MKISKKKFILAAAALALVFTFAACGGGKDNSGVAGVTTTTITTTTTTTKPIPADVGYYVIDTVIQGDDIYDSELLRELEIEYYINLNADGTMELSTDELIKGTWTPGLLSYIEDGEEVENDYTLAGDKLTVKTGSGDITLIYIRSTGGPSKSGGAGDTAGAGGSGDIADNGSAGDMADNGSEGDRADSGDNGDTAGAGDSDDTADGWNSGVTADGWDSDDMADGWDSDDKTDGWNSGYTADSGDSDDTADARGSGDASGSGSAKSASKGLPEALAWWDGDWYGYWTMPSASGIYEDLKDASWDCYAVIGVKADGAATVRLWDDDTEMALVEILINPIAGTGGMGAATSESGLFYDRPLIHADWIIMPEPEDYDIHLITISGDHKDSDDFFDYDEFRYDIYLRPWGVLWDDAAADERPPDYDWYLSVRNAPMEDAFED